jgi:trehalose/maltose hydrolase-like predicted phosphorylase
MIDQTVDAVVFDWEIAGVSIRPASVAALRRRVEALSAACVDVAVLSESPDGAVDERLGARPQGPGHVLMCGDRGAELTEIGPNGLFGARPPGVEQAEEMGGLRGLFASFAERGIGAGLVLLVGEFGPSAASVGAAALLQRVPEAACAVAVSVGVEPGSVPAGVLHLGGGAATLMHLLDEQLRRRRRRRVPSTDKDPAWTIRETGVDPLRHRVTGTLFTLGAGGIATRGSVEEAAPGSEPLVVANGVYDGTGPDQHLLPAPAWTGLHTKAVPAENLRILDLRTGVLVREETGGAIPLRSLRLVSASLPGVAAIRAEAAVGRLRAGPALQPPHERSMTEGRLDHRRWARVRAAGGAGIAAVAQQRTGRDGWVRTVERLSAYVSDSRRQPPLGSASEILDAAEALGFDRLLAEHRAAWAGRWEAVDVRIPDDPQAQLAIRFALFQLWCNVSGQAEAAVGARGLSGHAYSGHVFWDADVFVLPAVVSMDPAMAKAMIRYRLRRLPAAQAAAQASGHRGARFPWESAADGDDVTPTVVEVGGQSVPIRTGQQEEHVTADVAWSLAHYAEWSGDRALLSGPGRTLLAETARYWASRCRLDPQGRAHIDEVIGPDEYHDSVDDNAYTNVMARWNLRAAADACQRAAANEEEARSWRELAERIVDGYDPMTGRYEQFAGYFQLDPLFVADVAPPPVAADMLLGRERVAASQLIKQSDVLMLHHLVPDEVAEGSLEPNLDYYGPRTAHGSSLSPAIHAALLARAGRADEALEPLRIALALDLEDLTGTTAAGLHLATFGGVWQAILAGFAGVRVRGGVLSLDPRLPTSWRSLEVRFCCLGRKVRLIVTPDGVDVNTDRPLQVRLAGQTPRRVAGHSRLAQRAG